MILNPIHIEPPGPVGRQRSGTNGSQHRIAGTPLTIGRRYRLAIAGANSIIAISAGTFVSALLYLWINLRVAASIGSTLRTSGLTGQSALAMKLGIQVGRPELGWARTQFDDAQKAMRQGNWKALAGRAGANCDAPMRSLTEGLAYV